MNEHAIDEYHPDPAADPQNHAEAQQRRDALLTAGRRRALGQRLVALLTTLAIGICAWATQLDAD